MKNKKIINWTGILLIGILLFSFIFLVSALSSEEEILQLENELIDSGYGYLSVGVFEKDLNTINMVNIYHKGGIYVN